jgi:hypothetical protein
VYPRRRPTETVTTALVYHTVVSQRLCELNDRPAGPLALMDPRDLAAMVRVLADGLDWSIAIDGQNTEDRAVELGAWLLAFVLSYARARETDITAGDD